MFVEPHWLKLRYNKLIDEYYYTITKHQLECIAPFDTKVYYVPCFDTWPVVITND